MRSGFVLALVFCAFFSIHAIAQPGDPGGDPEAPIGGIEFLLGGGLLYGLRNLIRKHKKRA